MQSKGEVAASMYDHLLSDPRKSPEILADLWVVLDEVVDLTPEQWELASAFANKYERHYRYIYGNRSESLSKPDLDRG